MSIVVSYLVPSYNHEKYIRFLLESIKLDIEQLSVSAEVIIVDDGSSDDSRSIIQAWVQTNQGNTAIVHQFQQNKGITAVFNTLIDMSLGQYLRICASDDVIIAGSTQLLLNQFSHNPNLLCALADGRVIDEAGNTIHQSSILFHGASPKRLRDPKRLVKELIQHWCVAGPAILIKRSHYNNMRYDESSRIEDFDLFLSLLEVPNSVTFIEDTVCLYRIHTTNTSKTKNVEQRIGNLQSFLTIIDRYMKKRILSKYLLSVKYKSKAKIYFLQKKHLKCFFSLCLSGFFKVKSELWS